MAEPGAATPIHRIDPRLVHSTLIEAWIPHLGVERLVVADAEVAADRRRRTIFALSARDVSSVDFVAEAEVARHLEAVGVAEPTLVVYSGLEGFWAALEGGLECSRVLLGHLPDGADRRRVHPSVYLGAEDLELVERLRERGVEVVLRPLPTDPGRRLERGQDQRPVLTEDLPPAPEAPAPATPLRARATTPAPRHGAPTLQAGRVEVRNERGLHLRAAHLLASTASRFTSSVEVGWPGQYVNAKSLLGITTLGAGLGSQLELRAEGPDAEAAFTAIRDLFTAGFREGEA